MNSPIIEVTPQDQSPSVPLPGATPTLLNATQDILLLHLPNGQVYQFLTQGPVNVKKTLEYFAEAKAVTVNVVPKEPGATVQSLLLYGETLRRSFITFLSMPISAGQQ